MAADVNSTDPKRPLGGRDTLPPAKFFEDRRAPNPQRLQQR